MIGCEYCAFKENNEATYLYKNKYRMDVYLTKWNNLHELNIDTNGEDGFCEEIKINYCPMCGRKLGR